MSPWGKTKLPRRPQDPHVYGLLAEFGDERRLLAAGRAAHREGYRSMDAYTPFPVHGLSQAIGFRHTRLPLIVLMGGLFGCVGGFFMQWYTSVVTYPLNVGGRPFNSWPAFMIITFECTILAAGLTAVLGMLALNGLPRPYHPLFNIPEFELASHTHFFLCIEARDPKFDVDETRAFLERIGADKVTLVPIGELLPTPSPVTPAPPEQAHGVTPGKLHDAYMTRAVALLCTLGLLFGGGAAGAGCENVNPEMDEEARLETYEPNRFFAHAQSVRPLVEGTVARGEARTDEHFFAGTIAGKEADTFPFPVTRNVLLRGREQYTVFCAVCHNVTGDGNGMIVQRGFVRPPSLHEPRLRDAVPGHFFNVITNGWGAMYSYNDRITPEDRWAIAAYVRVLQFSQYADPNQLPPPDRAAALAALSQPDPATRPATAPLHPIDPDRQFTPQGSPETLH